MILLRKKEEHYMIMVLEIKTIQLQIISTEKNKQPKINRI
jgi:hypothetical protein